MAQQQTVDKMVIRSARDELDSLRYVLEESPCPYLPERQARSEVYLVERLGGERYEGLMEQGFRRSGRLVYRPRCRGCDACQPLRVVVARFRPTRSMRRVWRRNQDLAVEVAPARPTRGKYDLFRRYLDFQHDGTMACSFEAYRKFLYDSPMETVEVRYRHGARTAAVSILDRCPTGFSSVYTYFDPDYADRSLGTLSVLWEIEFSRRRALPYYYLGYFVADSPAMNYKGRFCPNEILSRDRGWISFRE